MTPALAALLKECEEGRDSLEGLGAFAETALPRLVAIVRAMDEDRERMRQTTEFVSAPWMQSADARIDALARGEEG